MNKKAIEKFQNFSLEPMRIIIVLLNLYALFYSTRSFCEYRVYQYLVKTIEPTFTKGKEIVVPRDNQARFVTSSLDPVSYIAYHGGGEHLRVDLLKTWMCMGSTANRESYCSPPKEGDE